MKWTFFPSGHPHRRLSLCYMNKIRKIQILLSTLTIFILVSQAYAVLPWPSPIRKGEDVVERYSLDNIDKMILKGTFGKIKFSNVIEERNDINNFLEGFRKCSVYDYFYNAKPEGEIIFLKDNREILKMGWFFFYNVLVFVFGSFYYTIDSFGYQFMGVFLKYVPEELREWYLNFKLPYSKQ